MIPFCFQSRRTILPLFFGSLLWPWLAGAQTAGLLQQSGQPAAANPEPAAEKSVEEIAELSRQSVVVVSHQDRQGRNEGVGSGFVIAEEGLIATCLHVIGEARPIQIQFADGRTFAVQEVHAWDRQLDLAIVRIEAAGLKPLALGNSDDLKQGMPVVAMGNPLGLRHSIVQGIVSARRDFDGLEMIQLAIPIEQGNSGGPVLDLQARVHGLLTMKSTLTPNLGFATTSSALKKLLDRPNPVPMDRWMTIGALNPRQWLPVMGARWSRRGGVIRVEELGQGFGGRALCLFQEPAPERPYELAVTVKLDDESGAAGLAFESDGDQVHYGFYPSGGQLRLTRFDGPSVFTWNILQQVATPHYRPGEWNRLKVRVESEKLLCYVNGHLVIEADEHSLKRGKAGLAKFRNTKASFKNFQLGVDLAEAASAPAPEVIRQVEERIDSLESEPSAAFLSLLKEHPGLTRRLLSDRARDLQRRSEQLIELRDALHRQVVETRLLELFEQPEEEIDLFKAALLLAHYDNPDLDLEVYQDQITEMASEIAADLPQDASDETKLKALVQHLFVDNGFHGSRTDYYNRANSYMDQVLDDREGLPITLSVLFLELARRIGLNSVTGVSLPGHFIVKFALPGQPEQLLDIFDGGKPLSRARANELVLGSASRSLREEDLQSARKREIIVRMLRNLMNVSAPAGSLNYLNLIVALAPESTWDRLDRARLRLQTGDRPGAKEDLKWILDKEPKNFDLDRVMQLYRSLD